MREQADVAERLRAIGARRPVPDAAMVADVVREVLGTMRGDLTSVETTLLDEVGALGRIIAAARAEIAALQVDDITASHIPSATDELDAIVTHTAAATESILEACETLDDMAGALGPAPAAALHDATARIYEACSFQDITGQRITKVVATLKAIDAKVAHIISAFDRSGDGGGLSRQAKAHVARQEDSMLLNGPQLPLTAMDQTDIDKLLASFD
jgi:chemotaxis protein CheZ